MYCVLLCIVKYYFHCTSVLVDLFAMKGRQCACDDFGHTVLTACHQVDYMLA